MSDTSDILVDLGFTALESEVYTALLRQSPLTGYRVAQLIGKPAANTYKAIESLQDKGAVIVDEGANRLCRAVPAKELLGRLERAFQDKKRRAASALAEIQETSVDDRVYQLRSPDQVLERCRAMLRGCRQVALLDIFPGPLKALRHEIEAAAARGVEVALKVYEPAEIAEAQIFLEPGRRTTLARWPGQWVNAVTDGSEILMAFLTPDCRGVHQAVWSGSVYLSWLYSGALATELILAGVQARIEEGVTTKELQKTLKGYLRLKALDASGYQRLIERFGGGRPEATEVND